MLHIFSSTKKAQSQLLSDVMTHQAPRQPRPQLQRLPIPNLTLHNLTTAETVEADSSGQQANQLYTISFEIMDKNFYSACQYYMCNLYRGTEEDTKFRRIIEQTLGGIARCLILRTGDMSNKSNITVAGHGAST